MCTFMSHVHVPSAHPTGLADLCVSTLADTSKIPLPNAGWATTSTAARRPERRTTGLKAGAIAEMACSSMVKRSPSSKGVEDAARSSVELIMFGIDASPSVSPSSCPSKTTGGGKEVIEMKSE